MPQEVGNNKTKAISFQYLCTTAIILLHHQVLHLYSHIFTKLKLFQSKEKEKS